MTDILMGGNMSLDYTLKGFCETTTSQPPKNSNSRDGLLR